MILQIMGARRGGGGLWGEEGLAVERARALRYSRDLGLAPALPPAALWLCAKARGHRGWE